MKIFFGVTDYTDLVDTDLLARITRIWCHEFDELHELHELRMTMACAGLPEGNAGTNQEMVMTIFFGFIDDLFRFIDDTPAAVMNQSYIVQAAEGKRPDRGSNWKDYRSGRRKASVPTGF